MTDTTVKFIVGQMKECEVWRNCSEVEFDNALEGMEKLVMNRLYDLSVLKCPSLWQRLTRGSIFFNLKYIYASTTSCEPSSTHYNRWPWAWSCLVAENSSFQLVGREASRRNGRRREQGLSDVCTTRWARVNFYLHEIADLIVRTPQDQPLQGTPRQINLCTKLL